MTPRWRIDPDPDGQWSVYRIDAATTTWMGAWPTYQAAEEMSRYLAYREVAHERHHVTRREPPAPAWPNRKVYP